MLIPTDQDQQRRVTVEQAEADYYAQVKELLATTSERQHQKKDSRRAETLRKPFGFGNEEWEALKAQMQPGDELWEVCSARASWDALKGQAGYELRRNGAVVMAVITRLN